MAREGLLRDRTTTVITSLDNPRVRRARKLSRRSARRDEGAFIVEGAFFVAEALRSGVQILDLFITDDLSSEALLEKASERGVVPAVVPDQVLDAISTQTTPQGVVAVVATPEAGWDLLDGVDLAVVLVGVQDPGNAGTLIRSAVAAGAGGVVFTAGSVDPFSPKTVRASAGNVLKIPVLQDDSEAWVDALRSRGLRMIGTSADAPIDAFSFDLTEPSALVIGNEAAGLSEEVVVLLDHSVSIPMVGPAESLNAGIAGSILLFEAVRQRRLGSAAP